MTDTDRGWSAERAIMRFAFQEIEAAGRKIAHRLRRVKASGIYGDYGHRTLWDEFRFETENGPTPMLDWAWDATIKPFVLEVVDRLPDHVAKLLSWHLASLEEDDPEDAIRTDLLAKAFVEAAKQFTGH